MVLAGIIGVCIIIVLGVSLVGANSAAETSIQPGPPPGWYPDPSDATKERWWDGISFSEKIRQRDNS
ncbi:DUF2510 domain-containing protein [Arthrobacter sp. efr-133-R2A-120]|uniref:DUF2510 domain-containing protein n=1 Tax=Arthrobacter sp. efr-133-R2A-120 TaxID=3040277 RepID=UPI0033063A21